MSPFTLTWHASRQPRLRLARRDEAGLGRQQVAAAFLDDHFADAAGALSAARRRDEDLVVGQRAEQRAAGGVFSVFEASSLIRMATSPVATSLRRAPSSTATSSSTTPVNMKTARTMSSMRAAYSWMPENIMNASDIRPATMNVMPSPFRPSGTWE